MVKFFSLIIGGSIGTVSRYMLSGFTYYVLGENFPYGTLIVNMIGCLFMGFLMTISEEKFLFSPELRIFLMIGFCGAFTTFSTFIFETHSLIRDGESIKAFFNMALSIIGGFLIFRIGILLGEVI